MAPFPRPAEFYTIQSTAYDLRKRLEDLANSPDSKLECDVHRRTSIRVLLSFALPLGAIRLICWVSALVKVSIKAISRRPNNVHKVSAELDFSALSLDVAHKDFPFFCILTSI